MAAPADQPNVVIILADDLGYGSLNCYGADESLIRTPNIDRLARQGRRFTDANTPSSVCSPTRYGPDAMTGGRTRNTAS
jgi:arylsulfatase A-like enzyme